MALTGLPAQLHRVLDIGCGSGYLLGRLDPRPQDLHGIDPRLADDGPPWMRLQRGRFPQDLSALGMLGPYDAIFALAVFEHFTDAELQAAAKAIPALLSPGGRLILTVPHPWVDRILDVLIGLRLMDGSAAEEHHGFDPGMLPGLMAGLKLVAHRRFQLGLNNLYVFEKES